MDQGDSADSIEVGHHSLNVDRSKPEGVVVAETAQPYAEGSQPPRLSNRNLTQVDAIVGGQAVRKQQAPGERLGGKSVDPKKPTHGNANDGPSAVEIGKKVMEMEAKAANATTGTAGGKDVQPLDKLGSGLAKKPEEEVGEAVSAVVPDVKGVKEAEQVARQDIENAVRPSPSANSLNRVPEEQSTVIEPELQRRDADQQMDTTQANTHALNLLGGHGTEQPGRPKGLGSAQALPQQRPEDHQA